MASERRESRVTATTYGASLWVLPRSTDSDRRTGGGADGCTLVQISQFRRASSAASASARSRAGDRKSTRLNSSHGYISYAVFCLKKKNAGVYDTRSPALPSPPPGLRARPLN